MKFRFCGDLDCPDWVLAEINTLSKMSSVKMRIFCQLVATALSGSELDEEKAKKIVTDANLDWEEKAMEACVSVLSSILTSSARYNVEPDVLASELEQLGLPKEHTSVLCKVYTAQRESIRSQLASQVLKLSRLSAYNCQAVKSVNGKSALMNITVEDGIRKETTQNSIRLTPDQLALLLSELRNAKRIMNSTESQ